MHSVVPTVQEGVCVRGRLAFVQVYADELVPLMFSLAIRVFLINHIRVADFLAPIIPEATCYHSTRLEEERCVVEVSAEQPGHVRIDEFIAKRAVRVLIGEAVRDGEEGCAHRKHHDGQDAVNSILEAFDDGAGNSLVLIRLFNPIDEIPVLEEDT